MKKLMSFTIGLLLALSTSGWATQYYVKNGGDDGAAGTSDDTAWATFDNINNRTFNPGDIIQLQCGSRWNQQMTLKGSGTPGNKIQITAYGTGAKPRIYRSNLTIDKCIVGEAVSYWKITQLQMDTALYGVLSFADPATPSIIYGIEIRDCDFSNMNYLHAGPALYDYGRGIYMAGYMQDGGIIANCTFNRTCIGICTQTYGVNGGAQCVNTSNNMELTSCTFTNCAWGGIAGNSLYNSTIADCEITSCGYRTTWTGPAGIQLYGATNVIVKNCSITNMKQNNTGMDGSAIDVDVVTNNITVQDCIIAHNEGPGIELLSDPDKNIIFNNCLIYDNAIGPYLNAACRYQFYCTIPTATMFFNNCGFYNSTIHVIKDFTGIGKVTETADIHSKYVPGWTPVYGVLSQIEYGGNGNCWGTREGAVRSWTGVDTGNCWTPQPGALVEVSCGPDGAVWGRKGSGELYQWNGSDWDSRPGLLTQLSAGGAGNIWGVNGGVDPAYWSGDKWVVSPGASLNQVAACKDGTNTAWGCAGLNVFRYNGSTWAAAPTGTFTQVSARDSYTAVGLNGQVVSQTTDGGKTWTKLTGNLSQVSIGSDGLVWGLAPDGTIWHYPHRFVHVDDPTQTGVKNWTLY